MRSLLVFLPFALAACGGSAPPTANPSSATKTPFVAQHIAGLGDPEIVVENRSDVAFTIALTGPTATNLEVPPHGKQTIRIKPGAYGYNASAPATLPLDGQHEFAKDMRYLWVFFVVKKSADDPEYVGKGWHCFEVKSKPLSYYVCTREKSHCEKLHAQPVKPDEPPIGDCAPQPVVHGFVDGARDIAVFTLDGASCGQIRASYLKQATDASKVTECSEKK